MGTVGKTKKILPIHYMRAFGRKPIADEITYVGIRAR